MLLLTACGALAPLPTAFSTTPTPLTATATALPLAATSIPPTPPSPTSSPAPEPTATATPTPEPTATDTSTPEPTVTPTVLLTETSVPLTPTKVPTKELVANFPAEILFDTNGSKLINRSTRFGVNGVNELKLPDGTPADGVNIIKFPTGTFAIGPLARKMAVEYVQRMFGIYGSRPDGGAGKQLVITIEDTPLQKVLWQAPGYQYYAVESDNAIAVELSLTDKYSIDNTLLNQQINYIIMAEVISSFLNGTPRLITTQESSTKPIPNDLTQLIYPTKLVLYRR
jgi:hypothetical protein